MVDIFWELFSALWFTVTEYIPQGLFCFTNVNLDRMIDEITAEFWRLVRIFRIDLAYNYLTEKQLLGGNRELIQTSRLRYCLTPYPLSRGGETPHMEGVGIIVGNFELNP